MLYFSAFMLGLLVSAGITLGIRWWHTRKTRQYGFREGLPQMSAAFYTPDDQSKFSAATKSVDGSGAVNEFNN